MKRAFPKDTGLDEAFWSFYLFDGVTGRTLMGCKKHLTYYGITPLYSYHNYRKI